MAWVKLTELSQIKMRLSFHKLPKALYNFLKAERKLIQTTL